MTGPDAPLGRLAAIDVGTNTIRLVVVEVAADRSYRILDDEKIVARLGRGLTRQARLLCTGRAPRRRAA